MQEGFPQIVNVQDDILRLWRMGVLEPLLADKTTGGNILWATDAYAERGPKYEPTAEITASLITGPDNAGIIQTRARKAFEQQSARTRQRAEVFTPYNVVQMMCDNLDKVWFRRKSGFYKTNPETGAVSFTKNRTWTAYVKSTRMEITCGEGPFLFTRYKATNGEEIKDVNKRVGLLDRKLRVVSENTKNEHDWLKWVRRAFQSVYGYELQGDNLLIARVNAFMSFIEYYKARWGDVPNLYECEKIIEIIVWNLWEMDGLTGTIPYRTLEIEPQVVIPGFFDGHKPCLIMDWRKRKAVEYMAIKKDENGHVKLDFITGNPPYQDETLGDNKGYAPPIYHRFLDGCYEVSDRVELIHPARFLFNAGSTPKAWNQKMLQDPHLKVVYYEPDASKLFSNTEIKGGVVVSYHDTHENYGEIGVYTPFPELNDIMKKAAPADESGSLMSIIYIQNRFNLEALYSAYPEYRDVIGSGGKDKRFRNNIFEKVSLFSDARRGHDDLKIIGVIKNKRVWRFFPLALADTDHPNLFKWKVLVVRVNGVGGVGEVLSTPVIAKPGEGYTQTFIGIGAFNTEAEAKNALKYVKTKFCRTMLGILKITQDNNRETWRMVPIQNFGSESDIVWTVPVNEIDQQLYKKYGLNEKEIAFIESKAKEMT